MKEEVEKMLKEEHKNMIDILNIVSTFSLQGEMDMFSLISSTITSVSDNNFKKYAKKLVATDKKYREVHKSQKKT